MYLIVYERPRFNLRRSATSDKYIFAACIGEVIYSSDAVDTAAAAAAAAQEDEHARRAAEQLRNEQE